MVVILRYVSQVAWLKRLESHFDWHQRHTVPSCLGGQAIYLVRVEASDVLGHGQGHRLVVELHAY